MKHAQAYAVFVLLAPFIADAYEFTGAKWNLGVGQNVQYLVNRQLSTDIVDDELCLQSVQWGYSQWNEVGCSYMSWSYGGRTDNSGWGVGDGENVVSWRESAWGDSRVALAITSTIFAGINNALQDTDIKFNGQHHSWAGGVNGAIGRGLSDVASVATHEVGHALGLDHSQVPGATMWPSSAAGDISGRTLSGDDIDAVCTLYPSNGERPDPVADPMPMQPMMATAEFGEPCRDVQCVAPLFCVDDGNDAYCSRSCTPGDMSCPGGYYCAYLSSGGGACVRGEDPELSRADFGEPCGNGASCKQGLLCLNDAEDYYCSGPCNNGQCPDGYFCASLQNGDSICAKGSPQDMEQRPGLGQPCTERGLCEDGLICLNDSANFDPETGRAVPYCTETCANGVCRDGYRCVDIQPTGTACQLVPSPGQRQVGQDCWINPERPWEMPTCGDGLICVGSRVVRGMVVETGMCTKNCNPTDCCPAGWGCLALTPSIGQCAEGKSDSPAFACESRPAPMGGPNTMPDAEGAPMPSMGTAGGSQDTFFVDPSDGASSSGGCALMADGETAPSVFLACILMAFGVLRRRHLRLRSDT